MERSPSLSTDGTLGSVVLKSQLYRYVKSSQVYTETTDNHTEAYRMCSGSQQGRTGVDEDGGGGSI